MLFLAQVSVSLPPPMPGTSHTCSVSLFTHHILCPIDSVSWGAVGVSFSALQFLAMTHHFSGLELTFFLPSWSSKLPPGLSLVPPRQKEDWDLPSFSFSALLLHFCDFMPLYLFLLSEMPFACCFLLLIWHFQFSFIIDANWWLLGKAPLTLPGRVGCFFRHKLNARGSHTLW